MNLKFNLNKLKYKKFHKKRLTKYTSNNLTLNFGCIGIKTLESGNISYKQIEATRQSINRKIKRKGKIWIKIFPHLLVTKKKSSEARMGKGKGTISHWISKIKGGTVLFELCGISKTKAIIALNAGRLKLPVKTALTTYRNFF